MKYCDLQWKSKILGTVIEIFLMQRKDILLSNLVVRTTFAITQVSTDPPLPSPLQQCSQKQTVMRSGQSVKSAKTSTLFGVWWKGVRLILIILSVPRLKLHCYTSKLKYVFRLEENVSRAMGQNSLTP